jgi:ribosome-interacting GTPase 1
MTALTRRGVFGFLCKADFVAMRDYQRGSSAFTANVLNNQRMPANLTADYRKAEEAFRQARELRDRLDCLKEMLRTIPKHKGTDHLQADIKSRIKDLTEELAGPSKGGKRAGPIHSIRAEGAAQIAMIGPPNAGKSSLHARLTGSKTDIGPYPLTTRLPIPGMLPFEDVHIQLIDLPPVSADFMETWIVNALQPADGALLVVDVSDPECVDQIPVILQRLAEKKIFLLEQWPGFEPVTQSKADDPADVPTDGELDPFRIELPTILAANKSDLDPGPDEVKILEELLDLHFPALACSATTGQGCDEIGALLFQGLQIVRVYTKTPGKPFKREKPFTVRAGQTILDVARLVHKDFAQDLRYARVWGHEVFDGQQVGPEHLVADGDIVELHTK